MLSKTYYLITTFALLFLVSCNKEKLVIGSDSYLVFGHFYGECLGEQCVEVFRLTDSQVFEYVDDQYGDIFNYSGEQKALREDLFEKVKDLAETFPSALLNEENQSFGCPDCADQGGIYLEYTKGDKQQFWLLDNSKEGVPNFLHEFMDQIAEKIMLINS